MQHQSLTDEYRDHLLLYALGELDTEAAQEVTAHLATGCTLCTVELRHLEQVMGLLGYHTPAVAPRPAVRERLLASLTPDALQEAPAILSPQETTPDTLHFHYVRAEEGAWHLFAPGIEVKVLFTDPLTHRSTALVRMEPGTHLQHHRHLAAEELFVLEGDCHVAPEHVLRAGDYFRAEAGSTHDITFTEAGTTFLTLCWNEFPT